MRRKILGFHCLSYRLRHRQIKGFQKNGKGHNIRRFLEINGLQKTYNDSFHALKGVDLAVEQGEILALLGPNGAGQDHADCDDLRTGKPHIRQRSAWAAMISKRRLSRGAEADRSGPPRDFARAVRNRYEHLTVLARAVWPRGRAQPLPNSILKQLSLWDKRHAQIKSLSGGMRRRVMIAKALVHEPRILFLDEPTAGVDVELRRDMWTLISQLKADGVTIILTTHYIDEAEAIADRIAVIDNGRILLVESKATLMQQMGQKTLTIELTEPTENSARELSGL